MVIRYIGLKSKFIVQFKYYNCCKRGRIRQLKDGFVTSILGANNLNDGNEYEFKSIGPTLFNTRFQSRSAIAFGKDDIMHIFVDNRIFKVDQITGGLERLAGGNPAIYRLGDIPLLTARGYNNTALYSAIFVQFSSQRLVVDKKTNDIYFVDLEGYLKKIDVKTGKLLVITTAGSISLDLDNNILIVDRTDI